MSRLAVMAHYDPLGVVAPHVRRQVLALAAAVDDVHVVSTAELQPRHRAWLEQHARLSVRPNVGYDFLSYRVGLDAAPDLGRYDEVVVCNDTYVGPLRDYTDVFESMADRPVDFWGLSGSYRRRPHVQSFFVAFRPWVATSRAFAGFWGDLTAVDDRRQVIARYELGLTAALEEAGFSWGAYFTETADDRRLAQRRQGWFALHRHPLPRSRFDAERLVQASREPWNPTIALADSALDAGRLPYVKLDILRKDPYDLGTDRLLVRCEQRFPDAFDGVRDHLDRTRQHYSWRRDEPLRPTPAALRPLRRLVEYGRAA